MTGTIDDQINTLERQLKNAPDDALVKERLASAYERAGTYKTREEALMLLYYPEIYKLIQTGYPETRRMMKHYGLDEFPNAEGVKIPQDHQVMSQLYMHLKAHPNLAEEIKQMKKATLQLVPVFEQGQEGAGFSRLVQAINSNKRIKYQSNTHFSPRIRSRWGHQEQMPAEQGKIIGWHVAVTEGTEELLEKSNPYAGEQLKEQLRKTKDNYEDRNLTLVNNIQYALLQMQALSQPDARTGIDIVFWTVLDAPARETGGWVPYGYWGDVQVRFLENSPDGDYHDARFRPSVVVDV